MKIKMKIVWIVLNTTLVALLVAVLIWLAHTPPSSSGVEAGSVGGSGSREAPLRIGLIPERDIFKQNKRYRALADYLSLRLDRPVQLVTLRTYEDALHELADEEIDAAFLGSFVAVLAMDRLGAKVTVKPESIDGTSTYHGVLFVRDDSPIRRLEHLRGRSIGMVRTTTAGQVFAGCVIMHLKLWNTPDEPEVVWAGTHDDVVEMVVKGGVDAGAVKNLRLEAVMRAHPDWKIRTLAAGTDVPNNALLLRRGVSPNLRARITKILLEMVDDPQGRETLTVMEAKRFLPCRPQEYVAIYNMVDCIQSAWKEIGVSDPPPQRPSDWPAPDPEDVAKCYDVNY